MANKYSENMFGDYCEIKKMYAFSCHHGRKMVQ